MEAFWDMNIRFLELLANLRSPFFDIVVNGITKFGEEAIVIIILCVMYWCVNKKMAYTTGMVFFSSGIIVQGLKITCRIPRPWVLDPSFNIVEAARATAGGYSFPSGHTQGAAAIYGSVGFWAKNKIVKVIFGFLR